MRIQAVYEGTLEYIMHEHPINTQAPDQACMNSSLMYSYVHS